MKLLEKALYRKYLEDARQARMDMSMSPHHCIHTGLDFDAKTRSEGFWMRMNAIQRLRANSRASSPTYQADEAKLMCERYWGQVPEYVSFEDEDDKPRAAPRE